MLTISHSLRRTLLLTVGAIAVLMTAAFFLLEYVSYRKHVVGSYQTLSATLGINLTPALTALHAASAREILGTIENEQDIDAAFLFDRFDRPLTYYKRPHLLDRMRTEPEAVMRRAEIEAALATSEPSSQFHRAHMTIFTPIFHGEDKLGTIYLVVSLRSFYQRIAWWLAAALVVMLATIPLGLNLASRLTDRITHPVSQLAEQMTAITAQEDYSVRAALPELDELHRLSGSFNAMLEQIELRDHRLTEVHAGLEQSILLATRDLRESEEKYRALFENSPISLWEVDFSASQDYLFQIKQNGVSDFRGHLRDFPEVVTNCLAQTKIEKINRATRVLLGIADAAALPQYLARQSVESHPAGYLADLCLALIEERPYFHGEGRNRNADGQELFLSMSWAVLPEHRHDYSKVVLAIEDLTVRKKFEGELLASLEEKEMLIREVHHRVKNNLQIISSLIRLQLKRFHDPSTVAELQTILSRIRSIALVHEKLIAVSQQIPDLREFVTGLAYELRRIYLQNEERVTIGIEIEELSGQITFDLVTSLVMILNELLTNAFKHAFATGSGRVEVTLRQQGEQLLLSVADNGRGFPAVLPGKGLGLTLVESLATQAHGSVSYVGPPGTQVTVTCSLETRAS